MSAMDNVPIKSICAGVAPVNGVLGTLDMESYNSCQTPNAKLMPHPVNTRVVEAATTMIGCLEDFSSQSEMQKGGKRTGVLVEVQGYSRLHLLAQVGGPSCCESKRIIKLV